MKQIAREAITVSLVCFPWRPRELRGVELIEGVSTNTAHGVRESGIEILRIWAMFLIVLNHFPWLDQDGFVPTVLNTVIKSWGGVGDCAFFLISAWFLANENGSIKRSFRRVWMLERQLLAYSIGLFIVALLALKIAGGGS